MGANDFDTSKAALVDASRVRVVTCGSPEFFDLVEGGAAASGSPTSSRRATTGSAIAKKFNLTVADLERINRFGAAHTELAVGQKLTVYVAMTRGREGEGGLRADAGRPRAGGERSRPTAVRQSEPSSTDAKDKESRARRR